MSKVGFVTSKVDKEMRGLGQNRLAISGGSRWGISVDPQDPRLGRRCALAESSGVHKAPALYNSSALHPLSRE
jgi:hypothetical protein